MLPDKISCDPYFKILTGLSRVHDSLKMKHELEGLIRSNNFDWGKLIAIFERQKILGLAYKNLRDLDLIDYAPHRSLNALRYNYLGNQSRNAELLSEGYHLISQLRTAGVDVRPLKGAVLTPLIYNDIGTRTLNDIDVFINIKHLREFHGAMLDEGYRHGVYESKSNAVVDLYEKEENEIFGNLFNLRPYRKPLGLPSIDSIAIDATYGLTFTDNDSLNREVLKTGDVIGIHWTLSKIDFLIHLCTHLFKEATSKLWEYLGQDVNIIKFCDIREYAHKWGVDTFRALLPDRALQLDVQNEVSFALKLTASIFNDSELSILANELGDFDDFYAENIMPMSRDKNDAIEREFSLFESLIRSL